MDARTYKGDQGSKAIVYSGLIAAAYAVLTIGLAPVSFGPLQFRVAGLLVPLCLLHRRYGLGLAVGLAMANVYSPFGWYDWLLMPIAAVAYYHVAYLLRLRPVVALLWLSLASATAVTLLPLHLGGNIPVFPTLWLVLASQSVAFFLGHYIIWRRFPFEV